MTMNNRSRTLTPRKRRLWTTDAVELTLAAGDVGVASQKVEAIGASFTASTSMTLRNATIGRVFMKGLWVEGSEAVTPTDCVLGVGMIVAQATLDATEFPSLNIGIGDYFLRDVRTVFENSGNDGGPHPLGGRNTGGSVDIDGKSQRLIRRESETPFVVVQKTDVVEFDFTLTVAVTVLWLY